MVGWVGVASMSLYERVQKARVSWAGIHSRSQGLSGVFGLSGVEDFREREKTQRQKRRNRVG